MSQAVALNGTEIAVIGMSGRFPGADGVDGFWRNVVAGVDSVVDLTDEQLLAAGVDPAALRHPQLVRKGMLLDGIDRFDAGFFGLPPREAEAMDPQHRLFLECAWEALEDAACVPETFAGLIGVFAGSGFCRYLFHNLASNPDLLPKLGDLQVAIGNERDSLCSMVSYKLDLRGPSLAVQTFCSTSLVAVHLACQSLINFECDVALAGGVAIDLPQGKGYFYTPGGVLSPDGRCRTFDARAEGSIMGNGVAIVALRRLEDALADRDPVRAVIRGSAINNDGVQKVGYTAPGLDGQAAVIAQALGSAGVDPGTVTCIEAHGTATPLGDSVELAALIKAYRSAGRKGFCALGSVKTNVGHLDRAAGTAGLIKAVLSLENRVLPPSLHFESPNPDVDLDNSPFYVNTELRPWERDGGPLRAGVSSFGVGGTNAHVILEEAPPREPSSPSRPWQLLVLSAKTAGALDGASARLAGHLRSRPDLPLADIAFTLQTGRTAFNHRRMLVCADGESAAAALETLDPKRVFSACEERRDRPVAFLLPGLGDHYLGMARGLYEAEPVFRAAFDRCAELLAPELGLDPREVVLPPESGGAGGVGGDGFDLRRMLRRGDGADDAAASRLNQTWLAQPAVFAVEMALARLLESWGVAPQALIGYSLGEYTAACLAGVLSLEDALSLVARRAALIQQLPAGAMLGVSLSEAEMLPWLAGDLCLAGVNGPALAVAAGPVDQVAALEERLTAAGVACRRVATTHAFHSTMMRPAAGTFREMLAQVRLQPPRIPYVSNVTGTWITPEQATDPDYWVRHLCEPVRFGAGLRELLAEPGRILLEVGPGQTLGAFARQLREDGSATVLPTLRSAYDRQPDQAYLLATLGRLWLAGARCDGSALYRDEVRDRVPLPTYAFERKRYWIEPGAGGPLAARPAAGKKPDVAEWFYVPVWKPSPRPAAVAPEAEEEGWLVFVDDARPGLAAHLAGLLRRGGRVVTVRPGRAFARTAPDTYEIDPREAGHYERLLADLRADAAGMPRRLLHLWSAGPFETAERGVGERFLAAQNDGFFSLLFLAQALVRLNVVEPLHLAVVTSGACEVTGAEELHPERATLAGPCRVIPQELLNVTCRSIDVALPPPGSWREERLAERLAADLAQEGPDLTVAWRGDDRRVLDYEPVRLEKGPDRHPRLREGGVYLLTGGLGGVGLILAEHLARRYRAKLVLVGRSGLPPRERWEALAAVSPAGDATARRVRKALELEAAGAEVLVVAADVADPGSLRAALDRARERFGTVHGVLHAAGISDDSGFRTLQETSAAECDWQFRPKVYGLQTLEEALRDAEDLDFVLLFSSLAAVLGGLGFVAYAAANAYMDAFVERLDRDSRVPWVSVNWDSWPSRDDQYAVVGGTVAEFTMTREEAGEAFERVLSGAGGARLVHSTGDLQARIDQWVKLEAAREGSGGGGTRHDRPELTTRYVEPETGVQRTLVEIWQDLLGIEPIGIHDDFFELGGHSLLATQMFSRLRAALAVDLPLRSVFEAPTVAGLAEMAAAEQPAPGVEVAPAPAIPRIDRGQLTAALLPSYAQQRLWFLDRLQPGNPFYNICLSARILGELHPGLLVRSLGEVVRRHEVLRTTFPAFDGRPVQHIGPPVEPPLPLADLRGLPEERREDEALRLGLHHHRQVFDLAMGPLLRFQLARLRDREHLFFFTIHHSVADDWSIGVFLGELVAIYEAFRAGRPVPLPELPIQYADFAEWQRRWLQEGELERQLGYWRRQLAGDLPVLRLPADRPRPAVQTHRGAALFRSLSAARSAELRELAQGRKVTLFMAMLAAFQTLLYRYTGQSDVLVGSPIAGRGRMELEGLIGFFVNNLVLRTDLAGDPPFGELLERVRQVTLDAYAHQDVPFEQLVDELRPERSLGHTPLFQAAFALQNAPLPGWTMGNLTIVPMPVDSGTAKFDVELMSDEREECLPLALEYSTDLFDAASVDRLLGGYQVLLAGIVADPERRLSELPLLTEEERWQLAAWNETARDLPLEKCAHELFQEQVLRTPGSVAVSCREHSLTYAELDRLSDGKAGELVRRGVGPGSVVALLGERGIDFLAAVLAVLKAGGAYLPLDPAHPAPRWLRVLELAGADLVLCGPGFAERLAGATVPVAELAADAAVAPASLPRRSAPQGLAYVIFTSGSTGTPKGAMVEHRGMLNHLFAKILDLGLTGSDVVAQNASQCFDISVWQLLAALLVGGRVHVVDDVAAQDPRALLREVERGGVTVLETVPSLLRVLLDEALILGAPAPLAQLRWMIPTGEALPPRLCRDWLAAFPGVPLLNAYGPTECSDDVAHHPLRTPPEPGAAQVPIGRPVVNLRLHVMEPALYLAPPGVAGELGVAGVGVGRGYLNDPARTAAAFIPDPWSTEPGARLYRTGDLARHRPGGEIEFLGRIDHQVKIRGHRIELGEIEAVLASHPAVGAAAVAVWRDGNGKDGGDRLAAYVVPAPGASCDSAELRTFLAERLPAAMLPAAWTTLEALPVTATGKLDRRALPRPELDGGEPGTAEEAPRSPLERRIAGLWRELLGVSRIGPSSHFFALGGDSVRGAIFINRLQEKLGRRVPVRALFEAPTLAALAERVEAEGGGAADDLWQIEPLPREAGRALPLSSAQQRLWFVERAHPGLGHYNSPAAFRCTGRLDLTALEAAVSEIVRRHEVLRARFVEENGVPAQQIAPAWRMTLPLVDLSALPAPRREETAERLLAEAGERPFDLERGPLLRWLLLQLGAEEHAVLLTLHHIVSDASTGAILVRELGELYRAALDGRPAALPPLPVQYADFAAWQRRWLDSGVLAEGLEYWGNVLRGPLQPLQLPVDRPRPERPSLRGAHLRRQLPPELAAGLRTLSWRSGVTLFTTLLAGFVALLFRRTRQDDILVGTAVEGRGRAEVEGLIGLFVNMLALRTDMSGDPSFATLLQRVREVAAGAFSHQDVPLDRLVEHLRLGRESAQSPLFQVAFGLDNVPAPPLDLPGLSASRLELRRETSRFDLTLWMVEEGEGLSALWTYSTDLFLEASIARLHEQYEALLAGALAAPEARLGDLPLAAPRREAAGEDEWGFVPGLRARRRPVALAEEAG